MTRVVSLLFNFHVWSLLVGVIFQNSIWNLFNMNWFQNIKKIMMYPFLLFHPHYFPHHYLNHHLLLMIQNLLVLRFWCQIQSIFPIHQIYEYLIIIIMYTTLFYAKTISKIIMKTFCWYLLHFFTLSLEISDICTIEIFLGSQNWQDYISNVCECTTFNWARSV